MSTSVTKALQAIEQRAERAIVQELRIMVDEVLTLRTTCCPEDRAYADGLLLKLDHLIDKLHVPSAHGELRIAGIALPQDDSSLVVDVSLETVLT